MTGILPSLAPYGSGSLPQVRRHARELAAMLNNSRELARREMDDADLSIAFQLHAGDLG